MSVHRLVLTFAMFAVSGAAVAQELTPRAYWPLPVGTNVGVLSYQRSTGDIVFDPSLPIVGVESEINFLQLTYQRAFSLLGRSANFQLSLPFADGVTEGTVEGVFRRRVTTGMTDVRARWSVNLRGAPAMDAQGIRALRKTPRTIVGASVLVQAPTGDYEPDKVINLGTNRWSIKPAVGVIYPIHPTWLFEFEVGGWFFSDNDDFQGQTRKQDPILSAEFHLIKRIRPGFWASFDANFYVGGRTRVGETRQANLQRNSRVGMTALFPLKGRHALRGSFSTGAVTESGGDFDNFTLSYLYAWQ